MAAFESASGLSAKRGLPTFDRAGHKVQHLTGACQPVSESPGTSLHRDSGNSAGAGITRVMIGSLPHDSSRELLIVSPLALYQKLLAMSIEGNLRAMALLLKLDGFNDNTRSSERALTSEQDEKLIAAALLRMGNGSGHA